MKFNLFCDWVVSIGLDCMETPDFARWLTFIKFGFIKYVNHGDQWTRLVICEHLRGYRKKSRLVSLKRWRWSGTRSVCDTYSIFIPGFCDLQMNTHYMLTTYMRNTLLSGWIHNFVWSRPYINSIIRPGNRALDLHYVTATLSGLGKYSNSCFVVNNNTLPRLRWQKPSALTVVLRSTSIDFRGD